MATTSFEHLRTPASYSNPGTKPTQATHVCDGPAAGLSFRNINVCGYATPTDYQGTVGNFPLFMMRKVATLLGISQDRKVDILKGCDGVVESGEMLLVLGRPGSGCTTFLRTVAGETRGLSINSGSTLNYRGPYMIQHRV